MKLDQAGLLTLASTLVLLEATRFALAADGMGISPLGCGSGSVKGIACQIRPFAADKYRPFDVRVETIQRVGYAASGYFGAASAPLTPTQAAALPVQPPGRQIVIKNGTYTSFSGSFHQVSSDANKPILIRPETPGGVTFVGETKLTFRGKNIVVYDLKIKDGTAGPDQNIVELGDSTAQGSCDQCVAQNLYFSNLSSTGSVQYLSLRGIDSTVAFSTFRDDNSPGHYIYVGNATESGIPTRPHVMRNIFFNRSASTNINGYELIQAGWSGVQADSAYGRIEQNLFESSAVPNNDTELVTIKSSDWIIRNNTFKNSIGALTLRSTNRVLVEGNYFLGDGAQYASGVRVSGAGHWIVNNYFYENANPPSGYPTNDPYYYSLSVFAGQVQDVANGQGGVPAAKNILIANNTFAYGLTNVQLGAAYQSPSSDGPPYSIMPSNVVVSNNLLRTHLTQPIFVLPAGHESEYLSGGNSIENNLISGSQSGLAGFVNPSFNFSNGLAWTFDGSVYRPDTSSSTVNAAEPLLPFPVIDTNVSFDLGAFQLEYPFRRAVDWTNTGYMAPYNATNRLASTIALQAFPWSTNRLRAIGVNVSSPLAPDGSASADKASEDSTAGTHSIEQVTSTDPTQVYTFSIYARGAGSNLMLYMSSPQSPNDGVAIRVDLQAGTVYSSYANGSASLVGHQFQALANGWYRVAITGKASSAPGTTLRSVAYLLQTAGGNSSYVGSGNAGIYLWGAQLEKDNLATVFQAN